jgi:hypothetical protein
MRVESNMISNIRKYKKDLEQLIADGSQLLDAIQYECFPKEFETEALKALGVKSKGEIQELIKNLPSFKEKYQSWYSESLAVVKFLLPDRVTDFTKLYEKPKGRKDITYGNYVIEDYLQGLRVTRGALEIEIVSPKAAIPQFQQQLNILKSAQKRFDSSLFDIKQLLQADLFDSELEAAKELNKKGFTRGAGTMAGVVLESHLTQVCENHKIKITKKDPTVNDLNNLLKSEDIIEVSTWRFIQHLGDLRNKCDHKKKTAPTQQEIEELIEGVSKIAKSIF